MPARRTAYSRVLFISPGNTGLPELDVAPEADALAELGYTVRALQGEVTSNRIFAAARNAEYAIIHFASHTTEGKHEKSDEADSDKAGVIITNGAVFNIDSILQVAKMVNAKMVFLNGCSTAIIGQTLIDEGVPTVIVTMIELKDELAKQTSQAFYKALAELGDLHEAYRASKPATRGVYQWLSNGGYTALMLKSVIDQVEAIAGAIDRSNAERSAIVSKNELEHQDFVRSAEFTKFRQWLARTYVITVATALVISVLFALIRTRL